ncbi:hypothetical protein SeMB42_g02194 [Synchytrium endobioticum]|uniref:SRP54-type proteins GTP-binding domain-containing protein n=1 Tax=Synchytrium endobioticum TaxID=286115 RepID=A0A507CMH6_9FUNG|nr:hypothetical protein SeLEV6574_g06923 [Synchytrium endobioticum]TPX50572.1 hypothetical protein SeMB42_g02194 [Synchytrium endobioticum]
MLDLFTVLTTGGIVLWSKAWSSDTSKANPINALIQLAILDQTYHQQHTFIHQAWSIQWTLANELGLIFVVVYQKILHLTYIDELLERVKHTFLSLYTEKVKDSTALHAYPDFDERFDAILDDLETTQRDEKESRGPRKFENTKKYQNTLEGSKPKSSHSSPQDSEAVNSDSPQDSPDPDQIARNLAKLKAKGAGRKPTPGSPGKKTPAKSPSAESGEKRRKQMRVWSENGSAMSVDSAQVLDFSNSAMPNENEKGDSEALETLVDRNAMGAYSSEGLYEAPEMDDRIVDENGQDDETAPSSTIVKKPATKSSLFSASSSLFSVFSSLTGPRILSKDDLTPVLAKMSEHLVNKNVAADIATVLCDSVVKNMLGQKLGTFSGVTAAVKQAMEVSLRKILTPRTSTDVLRDVFAAKGEGRPYSFVFVGVNGVGKSTNLSKVCFWLLQNKLRVLVAACDTFRSGAVEQLRVHARNLQALEKSATVELYERGYGKDSAGIAKDAISYAKANRFDVVLIDTAGRMQDNEPLMRALAKLVTTNNPDKIVFVGEALVGNEAVDQLTKFNRALRDFSGLQNPRQIDGIILSKFDTIDDKVGAALSMTYITGQPILFVGTGQTYTDLKRMNVKSIVDMLLSQ